MQVRLWTILVHLFSIWLLAWPVKAGAETPPPSSELGLLQAREERQWLYLALFMGKNGMPPSLVRRRGGLYAQDLPGSADTVGYWGWATNYGTAMEDLTAPFVALGTDLGPITRSRDARRQGVWVYRVAPSPHIVPFPAGQEPARFSDRWGDSHERNAITHAAVAGIPWGEIQASGQVGTSGTISWQENPEYDPRWNNFAVNNVQPTLSGQDGSNDEVLRQRARAFLSHLTSEQNTALSPEQRRDLRELLDWDVAQEPGRDFPLIRRRFPPSLQELSLRRLTIDEVVTRNEDALDLYLNTLRGIPTAAQCFLLLRTLLAFPTSGRLRKRAEQDNCVKFDHETSNPSIEVCHSHSNENCPRIDTPLEECVNLPENWGNVDSIRPSMVSGKCRIFRGSNCAVGDYLGETSWPELKTTPAYEVPFDQGIKSVMCGKPQSCTHFDELTVSVEMAMAADAGTDEELHINFGGSNHVRVMGPGIYRGDRVDDKPIDLLNFFGSRTVPVDQLTTFSLFSQGAAAEYWKVKDISFGARCAGSLRQVRLTKFNNIYEWVHAAGGSYPKEVKRTIGPRDWQYVQQDAQTQTLEVPAPGPDTCTHFKTLWVRLKLGGGAGGGTWDNVEICLDSWPCTVLARAPSGSHDAWVAVNLQETFGEEEIQVPGFHNVSLQTVTGDTISDGYVDGWNFEGISLQGDCAGSDEVFHVDKWASSYAKSVYRETGKRRTEFLSGTLDLADWKR